MNDHIGLQAHELLMIGGELTHQGQDGSQMDMHGC